MSEQVNHYCERDIMDMDRAGNYYCRHVSAMTSEGLHSKSDIAAELGFRDQRIDALQAEAEALRVALLGIASVNPAERGIEWAKSYASDGLKGAGSELYARWLDTFNEAEALRNELALQVDRSDTRWAAYVKESNMRMALERDIKEIRAELEAARGLLRDIFMTCNLRELPSEHAIRDISNQIEALLTATPAPEVPDHTERNLEMAEQRERQEAVAWLLHLPDGRTTLEKAYPKWAEEGDGYAIQPLFITPQPDPDVRGLVEALERASKTLAELNDLPSMRADIDAAIAAHRQAQQGGSHDT